MKRIEALFQLAMEESCEVATAASKCNRFTPNHAHYETSNLDRLRVEIRDLTSILSLIETELGVKFDLSVCPDKIARTEKYFEVQRQMGTLQE